MSHSRMFRTLGALVASAALVLSGSLTAQADSPTIIATGAYGDCPVQLWSDGTLEFTCSVLDNTDSKGWSGDISMSSVKSVKSGKVTASGSLDGLFDGAPNLTDISALSQWDVSNVVNMENMFGGASSLTDIDALAGWDVSSVKDMGFMFYYTAIADVDALAAWDTSNVSCTWYMFDGASSLVNLDGLASWDMSNVGSMVFMFFSASSLSNIDGLSNWDVSGVRDMTGMFSGTSITNVDALADWDTSGVTDMGHMFGSFWSSNSGVSITDVDGLAGWDVSSVTDMSCMFDAASALVSLDGLASWDVSSVTDMAYMFSHTAITDVDVLSGWDTSGVGNMSSMFSYASSLTDVDGLAGWDVSSVTDMSSMFSGALSLTNVDALAKWNTSKVTGMGVMFSGASSLRNVDGLENWDTANVTSMSMMFANTSIVNVDPLVDWDVSSVSRMYGMFWDASSLVNLDGMKDWDVSSVTDMDYMFDGASALVNLDSLSKWNVSSVTGMGNMFSGASSLTDIDGLADWDTSSVTDIFFMFCGASSLKEASFSNPKAFSQENAILDFTHAWPSISDKWERITISNGAKPNLKLPEYMVWVNETRGDGVQYSSDEMTEQIKSGQGEGVWKRIIPVSWIEVMGTSSVQVGSSVQLEASVEPSNASNKAVLWSSSDASVASVDSSGRVTGKKPGTATITATAQDGSGVYGSMSVTVVQPVTGVLLSSWPDLLEVGQSAAASVTVEPDDASDPSLSWSSSNPEVATVDKYGWVTGIKAGTATITATSQNRPSLFVEFIVTVTQSSVFIPVSSVALNGVNAVNVGESTQLTATVSPSDATNKSVTWKSSDTSIATVNADGIVTGKKPGTVTIKATAQDGSAKSALLTMTVRQPVTSVMVFGESSVLVGSSVQLEVSVEPSDASDKSLRWKSSNTAVATVDASGRVTGKKAGIAIITATAQDGSGEFDVFEVTVALPMPVKVSSVKLSGASKMTVGESITLKATVSPLNAANKAVTWKSSNTGIATVDTKGKVTAKKAGTVTITATAKDGSSKKASKSITVVQPVASVKVSGSSNVQVGKTISLKATVVPSNASDKTVAWTSSNPAVATVDAGGKVTGKKAGTVTIRATAQDGSGKYGSSKVTVVQPVTSVKVSGASSVAVGSSVQFTAAVSPSDASDKSILWISSNTSVATVDATGKVTGKKAGAAYIWAFAQDGSKKFGSSTVTVTQPVTSVKVSGSSSVQVGKTVSLKATVVPSNATDKAVLWKSSNAKIATVNAKGVVKGVKPGEVTITATARDGSGKKASKKITVIKTPESVQVMYRLYNRISHEHLYTANENERDTLARGDWNYEGVGWVAPKTSKTPVYRLYNPALGDHHYTTDENEMNELTKKHGWRYEGVGWYSDDQKRVKVYRQFNPAMTVGSHNYTADKNEYDVNNARNGWQGEGDAWYAVRLR